MMRKKEEGLVDSFKNIVPELPDKVDYKDFFIPQDLNLKNWNIDFSGSDAFFDDYKIGEINHLDGQTIEEAEHQMATRLYQNNARFILISM